MLRCAPLSLTLCLFLVACGSVPSRNAVPPDLGLEAGIPGIPLARFWGDEGPHAARHWESLPAAELDALHPAVVDCEHHYLAISGGGENAAFGAGLLKGWTEHGSRPEFQIVTGVSAGALLAPFAFLGPECDDLLRKLFTTTSTDGILEKRSTLAGLTSDAMYDSEPLRRLLAEAVTEEMLEKIAAAHRSGRRLLIGTTNLDAMRPVIWNMGAIAASDAPHRVELFRSILLASASIPAVFPPVLVPVEIDGKPYDELHVDGGTCSQVFLLPTNMNWEEVKARLRVRGQTKLYVIRNARVEPKWKPIEPGILEITGRAISTLIRTQGLGDLYRIWIEARENGMDYHLAYISSTFALEPEELFDTAYMVELYDVGYRMARIGYPWEKAPPGEESATRVDEESTAKRVHSGT
jgi:hypothetical protein